MDNLSLGVRTSFIWQHLQSDTLYLLYLSFDMYFIWDENKNRINVKKHGVSFEQACKVFNDARKLEKFDTVHSTLEDRSIIIGQAKENLLFVVNTELTTKL
ncbi:MAG: BrnT family toxin [Fibromonadaceae bacterium]|nr:BrnT family toxin [Fibromonadaceae bacterium]